MEVPKDFAPRMAALAEDIPREVIASLLAKLLPREPVRTRPPSGAPRVALNAPAAQPSIFKPVKARRRSRRADAALLRKRIYRTTKGLRRLLRVDRDDILHVICAAETVRDAINADPRISAGDITYAERVGYITLGDE